jgi:hypothetical protein
MTTDVWGANVYLPNFALLVTHQIDSAYWRECELFHLPGGVQLNLVLNFLGSGGQERAASPGVDGVLRLRNATRNVAAGHWLGVDGPVSLQSEGTEIGAGRRAQKVCSRVPVVKQGARKGSMSSDRAMG